MSWVFAILLVLLLAVGSFFILVGSFSLVKLSEFFKRLHGPTKASTLGVGCVLIASVGYHALGGTDPQPRELLITAFLFITAPISAHLMAKAALPRAVFDFADGAAEDESALSRNETAFDGWDFLPKPGRSTRRFTWAAYSNSPTVTMPSRS